MALLNILRQFNWVDIFCVIVLIRICCVAIKHGFPEELFKLLGTLSAVYLALHYYITFPYYIVKRIGVKNIPADYLTFFSFFLLAAVGYLIFVLLRKLVCHFIHMEAVSGLNKWGGLLLGIFRSFLFMSLMIFVFAIAPTDYFRHSVNDSYSGKGLFKIAPTAYTWLWNSVMSKFMAQETSNDTISEVEAGLTKK